MTLEFIEAFYCEFLLYYSWFLGHPHLDTCNIIPDAFSRNEISPRVIRQKDFTFTYFFPQKCKK